jgi:hypothetical protein
MTRDEHRAHLTNPPENLSGSIVEGKNETSN